MQKSHPKYLFLKGELVEYDQARVHVLSSAFKYGAIVFEGLRGYFNEDRQDVYGFRIDDHVRRLISSMKVARIPGRVDVDWYRDTLLELIRANDLREDLHMRIQVFVETDDGTPASMEPVAVSMAAMPMARYLAPTGVHVAVSSWTRISERSMPPRIKTVPNYHNARLAMTQAKLDGYDDAIMLTPEGRVAEGGGYNVFVARDGQLLTPPATEAILEGITRDSIIQLARGQLQLDVTERPIDRTELYLADEMFFCGSAAEVTPILSVDRHAVGNGEVGPVTRELRAAYLDAVRGKSADRWAWLTPVYESAPAARATAATAGT